MFWRISKDFCSKFRPLSDDSSSSADSYQAQFWYVLYLYWSDELLLLLMPVCCWFILICFYISFGLLLYLVPNSSKLLCFCSLYLLLLLVMTLLICQQEWMICCWLPVQFQVWFLLQLFCNYLLIYECIMRFINKNTSISNWQIKSILDGNQRSWHVVCKDGIFVWWFKDPGSIEFEYNADPSRAKWG